LKQRADRGRLEVLWGRSALAAFSLSNMVPRLVMAASSGPFLPTYTGVLTVP